MDKQKQIDEKIAEAKKLGIKMKNQLFYGSLAFLSCWIGGSIAFGLHQQNTAVFLILNGMIIDQGFTKLRNMQVDKFNDLCDEINGLGEELGVTEKVNYQKA